MNMARDLWNNAGTFRSSPANSDKVDTQKLRGVLNELSNFSNCYGRAILTSSTSDSDSHKPEGYRTEALAC